MSAARTSSRRSSPAASTALVGFSGSFPRRARRAACRRRRPRRRRPPGCWRSASAPGVVGDPLAAAPGCRSRWPGPRPARRCWCRPGAPGGGFPAAVGAFLVCGALIVLSGLWAALGPRDRRDPGRARERDARRRPAPDLRGPVRARRSRSRGWPLPVVARVGRAHARVAAVGGAGRDRRGGHRASRSTGRATCPASRAAVAAARLAPSSSPRAIVGIALPLFIVTMASQNIAGHGVLASFGYRPPLAPILGTTGIGDAHRGARSAATP